MTQEEKELLLKDLCARLPYGVKVQCTSDCGEQYAVWNMTLDNEVLANFINGTDDIKPYLRPMSSMTEEEMIDFLQVTDLSQVSKRFINDFKSGNFGIMANMSNYARNIDWLNKKMFDFRGLIPKDLALSTEEFNPYKD